MRAIPLATLIRTASMAPPVGEDSKQTLFLTAVANVIDQRPRSVEGGRAEIIWIPAHRVTSCEADTAVDAFDSSIGFNAGFIAWRS